MATNLSSDINLAQQEADAAQSLYEEKKAAYAAIVGGSGVKVWELSPTQQAALSNAQDAMLAARRSYERAVGNVENLQLEAQRLKDSSLGQTAEDKVTNDVPAKIPGAGQGVISGAAVLSSAETANLNSVQASQIDPIAAQEALNAQRGQSFQTLSEATSGEIFGASAKMTAAGADASSTNFAGSSDETSSIVLLNKLHNFTGYTYRITLYLLTADDYKQLSISPVGFIPQYVLISSGGGVPPDVQYRTSWHPDFQEDFYFDNFSMTTVVGLNSRSKASNAIDIKFNIIEPYGMSLLDRLLSACQTTCGAANYIDQPYMLQIDFLSNPTEANTNGISDHLIDRKKLAIKFIELKIKPGVNGTTYSVRAIPYNHAAFNESVGTVPVNLSVEAATVGDYFDSREELMRMFDQSATKDEERIESELNKLPQYGLASVGASGKNAQEELKKQQELIRSSAVYSTKSFPAAYNTYYKNVAYLEGRTTEPMYQILFDIHPDIANSPIIDTAKIESRTTPLNDPKASVIANTAQGTNKDFKTKSVFQVLSGTSVIALIDRVVSASKYVKDQVKTTQENSLKPTDWYKIIPTVELGPYDNKSKSYSKKITYSIIPYETGNFYHPDFAQTQIKSKQCVRKYSYYYTGENQDIIQLDIDFDASFVTGVSTFNKYIERNRTNDGAHDIIDDTAPSLDARPSWLPKRIVLTPIDTQMIGQNNRNTAEDASVSSVARSLYSSYPRGDMLNIKMRIVGDPAFIKQDDVLIQPTSPAYGTEVVKGNGETSPPINANGQIIFDTEQVYVQLIVKGAIDIDDTIGIVNKTVQLSNGQQTNGSFSGIYRVMTVTSEFSRGKFEQVLDLIRVPDDLVEIEVTSGTTTSSLPGTMLTDDNISQVTQTLSANPIIDGALNTPGLASIASGPASSFTI